jgi:transcriptional regulator with XRE-family HTH domain
MNMKSDRRGSPSDAFANALRDAINAKGVTLARLHEQLRERGNRVSMATLSYWRSGARRPEGVQSLAALADLEELLGVRVGSLTGLLAGTNRTGPLGPTQFPIDEAALERAVRETYAALGAPYPDVSRELTVHSLTDVGADGSVRIATTRAILRSTVGTLTATPFLELTPGLRTPAPLFSAVSGGRISQRYSHPDGEVHGVLFELETPLVAPNTTVVEWSMEYPAGYPPMRETGYALSRQCRELLVWTRFDPEALPDWIEERVETPHGVQVSPLPLDGRTAVHIVRRAFGPGAVEMRWGYGEREPQPG